MGLFSDIWDWCKSKVQGLINSAISGVKTWAKNTINSAIAGIQKVYNYVSEIVNNVYNTFTEYITNVYNSVSEYISNVVNNVYNYVSNVYNTTVQNITNTINNITKYVTNITKVYKNYVTNITGTTTEWVMGYIAQIIPADFIRDPWGYLQAAFGKFIETWILGVTGDLAEGLQAGATEEEPGIHGAGESFMRGFNEVVNEETPRDRSLTRIKEGNKGRK